ncbi:hypothetical protein M2440_005508, partial [Methylorubrum extorquens]|nr:hypothetical protein [Methylorubrum extorquens]
MYYHGLLDNIVVETVKSHFDPLNGSTYWNNYASIRGIDPFNEVKDFHSFEKL